MASNMKDPAVAQPSGTDPQWAKKVTIAKAARAQAKALRDGKPMTFSTRRAHRRAQ